MELNELFPASDHLQSPYPLTTFDHGAPAPAYDHSWPSSHEFPQRQPRQYLPGQSLVVPQHSQPQANAQLDNSMPPFSALSTMRMSQPLERPSTPQASFTTTQSQWESQSNRAAFSNNQMIIDAGSSALNPPQNTRELVRPSRQVIGIFCRKNLQDLRCTKHHLSPELLGTALPRAERTFEKLREPLTDVLNLIPGPVAEKFHCEYRFAGFQENGQLRAQESIWILVSEEAIRRDRIWRKFSTKLKRLCLDSPQFAKIYIDIGLASYNGEVAMPDIMPLPRGSQHSGASTWDDASLHFPTVS